MSVIQLASFVFGVESWLSAIVCAVIVVRLCLNLFGCQWKCLLAAGICLIVSECGRQSELDMPFCVTLLQVAWTYFAFAFGYVWLMCYWLAL